MTKPQPADAPTDLHPVVDPASITDDYAGVDMKPTGLIVIHFPDGGEYRLRAPFFGELKDLRVSQEDTADAIRDLHSSVLAEAKKLDAKATAEIEAIAEDDLDGRAKARAKARDVGKAKGRAMVAEMEAHRVRWWKRVFDLLSLDGPLPEDLDALPAWLPTSPDAPPSFIAHWQGTPVGPGKRRG